MLCYDNNMNSKSKKNIYVYFFAERILKSDVHFKIWYLNEQIANKHNMSCFKYLR